MQYFRNRVVGGGERLHYDSLTSRLSRVLRNCAKRPIGIKPIRNFHGFWRGKNVKQVILPVGCRLIAPVEETNIINPSILANKRRPRFDLRSERDVDLDTLRRLWLPPQTA